MRRACPAVRFSRQSGASVFVVSSGPKKYSGVVQPDALLRHVREWFGEPAPNWLTSNLAIGAP